MKRIDNIWTQENTILLKRLWAEKKLTGQEIATMLGTTRSAVLGKVRRMKLPYRTEEEAKPKKTSKESVRQYSRPDNSLIKDTPERKRRQKRIEQSIVDDPSKHCTLLQLKERTCRYPVDGGKFCGQHTQEESSYCPGHHSLCTIPTVRRRGLPEDLPKHTPWRHWKPVG